MTMITDFTLGRFIFSQPTKGYFSSFLFICDVDFYFFSAGEIKYKTGYCLCILNQL